MPRPIQLLDHRGNPVQRAQLKQEIAIPTTTGLRNPMSGYPGDGLNPLRLHRMALGRRCTIWKA